MTPARETGPHIGPFPVTATGILLLVALVGSVFIARRTEASS